jgi:hypothetical protein
LTPPSVQDTIDVEFSDGRQVVPEWWGRYMRPYTVGYRGGRRVLSCTKMEMQDIINRRMTDDIFWSAVRRSKNGRT